MSHALATVLHRSRKDASNVTSACLAPHGELFENESRFGVHPRAAARPRRTGTDSDSDADAGAA
jgi:hypothetical protein